MYLVSNTYHCSWVSGVNRSCWVAQLQCPFHALRQAARKTPHVYHTLIVSSCFATHSDLVENKTIDNQVTYYMIGARGHNPL
jgi:hypothetical protein